MTDWCKRFCFTADIFLQEEDSRNEKPCQNNQVPMCDATALSNCPYYGYAPCRLSLCNNCSLSCHLHDQDIQCDHSQLDCEVAGLFYLNNEEIPSHDLCQRCYCFRGSMECESIRCPILNCDYSERLAGSCCPTCKMCQFEGEIYEDGQRFQVSDVCYYCICNKGTVECEKKGECNPQCSYPAKLPHQCCPVCDACDYKGTIYRNGAQFYPDPSDTCRRCKCLHGNVECFQQPCPQVTCTSPQKLPNECCAKCYNVCYDETSRKVYQEGDNWRPSDDVCTRCTCKNSQTLCSKMNCALPNCLHAAAPFGVCCPECDHCEFTRRLYRNGQEFTHQEDPCQRCICLNGNVSCETVHCDPLPCVHPEELKGFCCPVCPPNDRCYFNGQTYDAWENFMDPINACSECVCIEGMVSCHPVLCRDTDCPNPQLGECCQSCDGCSYEESNYLNQAYFPDPLNECRECRCLDGAVSCQPSSRDQCQGCFYNNEIVENGRIIDDDHTDICQECSCNEGSIHCQAKSCPPVYCTNPVIEDCCPVCHLGCFYNNEIVENGRIIDDDGIDICQECSCNDGSIHCQAKSCSTVYCTNPVIEDCCPVCHLGCFYNNEVVENGRIIVDDRTDICQECSCNDGNIHCQAKTCPTVNCTYPLIEDCCPVCHLGCFYNNEIVENGRIIDEGSTDICQECACNDGNIHCQAKSCPNVYCTNPVIEDCCPVCNLNCLYNGTIYKFGAKFKHPTDPCTDCACMNGNVICKVRPCPEVLCSHPALEKCCLECENCAFQGEHYADAQNFTNLSDPCETCLCTKGEVTCRRTPCLQCLHPFRSEDCCPICDGCFYKSINYTNQELFTDPENACQECICKSGTVTCHELSCSLPSCANPIVQLGDCCPSCPGCELSGLEFEEKEEFTHPDDVCKKCVCKDSQVVCRPQICSSNCSHPVPGTCCPVCKDCIFATIIYSDGESFHPDPCKSCKCKSGNVLCTSEECPQLSCPLRYRLPGKCCESCRGCIYEGKEYENEETWLTSSRPCLSCSCSGGTVSCKNSVCHVDCAEPVPVPGLCCPVCPECERNNQHYKSGEVFSPDGNPCESCLCDSGHIVCIRHECPTLIACPEEAIKPPGDGECCPTCAGFGTTCTRNQIGKLVHPSDDPCFTCECSNNFMWVCSKEFCPPINCPLNEVIKHENECCPKCKVCLADKVRLHEESWSPSNDICSLCYCNYGHVECQKITCPVLRCEPSVREIQIPGECCPVCAGNWSCDYGVNHYKHGQAWSPDPCTVCKCSRGEMQCLNERCLPLVCTSDEIQSVDPGRCCPKCMSRPATCVAFGDPHYRTFDGAAISFQGTCRYVLTADCSTQQFNVLVENNDRGLNGVSWTHRVVVVLPNASVDLRAGPSVYVKGNHIHSLPYFEDPVLYVENTGSSVLVTTNVGVQVLWDGDGYVEVIVSGDYRDKTCGLCGNFNNFPQDDMQTPTNEILSSEANFGNSWKNPGAQPEGCADALDIDPCSVGGYRIRKIANNRCSILKQSLFAPCHRFIPPEAYFAACVYDVCACSENDDCMCDILTAYSRECSKAGLIIHWRREGLCGIRCSHEEGFFFDECGPPCPRTCENKNVPVGILAAQCFKPCVPGCQCSADKVLHNGRCIRPETCP